MAQVLKEFQREKILASALFEFYTKGEDEASMRMIAKNAQMTVGNLYCYYPGKKELLSAIIQPVMDKINEVIMNQTEDRLSLFSKADRIGFSKELIQEKLLVISKKMILLVKQYPYQMKIIIQNKEITRQLHQWLSNLIVVLVMEFNDLRWQQEEYLHILSEMFASDIISGMVYLIDRADDVQKKCELDEVMNGYLQMIFSLLKEN